MICVFNAPDKAEPSRLKSPAIVTLPDENRALSRAVKKMGVELIVPA